VAGDPGWRDPRLGMLRVAGFIVIAALLVWVVVVEDGPNDLAAIGTLLGSLMVLLGFGALVKWQ
jgi:hypothetical protein